MKQSLRRVTYPHSLTRQIFIFFILAILPGILFSLLNNGIQEYGNKSITGITSNTILQELDAYGDEIEPLYEVFEESKEVMKTAVGSSYEKGEYVISGGARVSVSPDDGIGDSSLYIAQSIETVRQYFNYRCYIAADFTSFSEKEGVYVSSTNMEKYNLKEGDEICVWEPVSFSKKYRTVEIIGYFTPLAESKEISQDSQFYFVTNDVLNFNFEYINHLSISSLHYLDKSISLLESSNLAAKTTNYLETKATLRNFFVGSYTGVLETGELFSVISSVAIAMLMFYSILGRGEALSKVHHIQYLYYKDKRKVCLSFVLDNLASYAMAIVVGLAITGLIALVVNLKYHLTIFFGILPVITMLIDAVLIAIASVLSFIINQKKLP